MSIPLLRTSGRTIALDREAAAAITALRSKLAQAERTIQEMTQCNEWCMTQKGLTA